jgi:Tfp pilus assembly protein PilX
MASHKQTGFVLVTSLVFLIVLSLLGVMALRGSLFEERMSANDRDRATAREYAEMALRDAERDILGLRFDGAFCATAAPVCSTLRPAGTRPINAVDAGNFWIASSLDVDTVALANGGLGQANAFQGMYTANSALACGRPVWSGADWQDNVVRSCAGTIAAAVPTVPYGRFTDAPFVGPDGVAPPQGIPRPRYLIELFTADELGISLTSNKLFFRITAVGFGKTVGPTGRNSVTLQSVFSPF